MLVSCSVAVTQSCLVWLNRWLRLTLCPLPQATEAWLECISTLDDTR